MVPVTQTTVLLLLQTEVEKVDPTKSAFNPIEFDPEIEPDIVDAFRFTVIDLDE